MFFLPGDIEREELEAQGFTPTLGVKKEEKEKKPNVIQHPTQQKKQSYTFQGMNAIHFKLYLACKIYIHSCLLYTSPSPRDS